MAQGFRDTRFLRALYINAHRPPTATDDETVGVSVGVRWVDDVALVEYICMDDSTGAAVWLAPSNGGGSGNVSWRGDWSSGTVYAVNDMVSYGGGTYMALQTSTNVLPDTLSPNWAALTSPGVTVAYANGHYRAKSSFVFSQGVASAVWTITHNLGTYPGVTVVDSTGETVDTEVRFIDANTVQIAASFPFSGQAFLT